MKAVVWTKYGTPDGLQLREVPQPAPKDNEVLIQVYAATVATPDTEFRRLKLPFPYGIFLRLYLGLLKPSRITILGTEFAGQITAVGKDVTTCQPGEKVFGYTGLSMGTYTEYLRLPEKSGGMFGVWAGMPANASYEEAAAVVFGGLEARHTLQQIQLQPGQSVLIVGAGGSIGTCAVQLARAAGAEVTGVDHPSKLELLRSLGAAHVIDYTREDFTQNGRKYEVILDTIDKSPFAGSVRSLKDGGAYLNANLGLFSKGKTRRIAEQTGKKIIPWSADYSVKNLLALKELVEAGTLRAIIDRRYPLAQAAEAHRYVDTGLKKGNVILTVVEPSGT